MLPSIPTPLTTSESNAQAAPENKPAHSGNSLFGIAFDQVSKASVDVDAPGSNGPGGNSLPPGGTELPNLLETTSEFVATFQNGANYDIDVEVVATDGDLTARPDPDGDTAANLPTESPGLTLEVPGGLAALGNWGQRTGHDSALQTSVRNLTIESRPDALPISNQETQLTLAPLPDKRVAGIEETGVRPQTPFLMVAAQRQHGRASQLNEIQSKIPELPNGESFVRADRELRLEPIVNNLSERSEVMQKSDLQLPGNTVASTHGVLSSSRESLSAERITAPLTTTIDRPVMDKAWGTELQEKVLWMTNRNIQNAEIRLNPAELGPIRIQVSVEDDAATVMFTAQHTVTREAIELALPRLREMLSEHGLSLAGSSVTDAEDGELRKDDRARDHGSSEAETKLSQADDVDDSDLERTINTAALIDTFA